MEEIGRLQKGDILVCQVTNPTWASVFQKISAAVSDIGGSMSHAAIVAREYGLPAVVGTGTATSRIKDGQRIRVDGGRGVVTLLLVTTQCPYRRAWARLSLTPAWCASPRGSPRALHESTEPERPSPGPQAACDARRWSFACRHSLRPTSSVTSSPILMSGSTMPSESIVRSLKL